jgi:hypothetical protein
MASDQDSPPGESGQPTATSFRVSVIRSSVCALPRREPLTPDRITNESRAIRPPCDSHTLQPQDSLTPERPSQRTFRPRWPCCASAGMRPPATSRAQPEPTATPDRTAARTSRTGPPATHRPRWKRCHPAACNAGRPPEAGPDSSGDRAHRRIADGQNDANTRATAPLTRSTLAPTASAASIRTSSNCTVRAQTS